MILRTPRVPRAGPVRASYGLRTEIFHVIHIIQGPCGTLKGAVRQPYGHVKELTQSELAKLPHGRRIWPCGARTGPARASYSAVRAVPGLFTNSKPVRGPLAYNACIKTLRAPYGEAKFVRRRTGAERAPWVDVQSLFKTAREQPVRGPGVWCDWGINEQ